MRLALSKTAIEAQVANRLGDVFQLNNKEAGESLGTGITEIDAFVGGLPRGAITEIFGPVSSGRTSFMLSALVHATNHEEVCALVDTNNVFDPTSAMRAEINYERLLWIRCANNLEHAFKATDLLLQGGGFGLVMLDLGDVPAQSAKRIISSWWYRFRRTLEATPTALVVITQESCVRSCASLALELKADSVWSQAGSVRLSEERSEGQENILYPVPRLAILNSSSRMTIGDLRSVTHANLLRASLIQIERRRPVNPGLKGMQFRSLNPL